MHFDNTKKNSHTIAVSKISCKIEKRGTHTHTRQHQLEEWKNSEASEKKRKRQTMNNLEEMLKKRNIFQ